MITMIESNIKSQYALGRKFFLVYLNFLLHISSLLFMTQVKVAHFYTYIENVHNMPEIDDDYTKLIWPEYETYLAPLRARQYKNTDIILREHQTLLLFWQHKIYCITVLCKSN